MSDSTSSRSSRRRFLAITSTAAFIWTAGCVNVGFDSDIGEDASYDGYLSDANGYDGIQSDGDRRYGVVRRTNTEQVEIKVGSPIDSDLLSNRIGISGGGGPIENAFLPAAIEISPGTTVKWVWTGDGGQHNITAKDGSLSSPYHTERGTTFTHKFEETGITRYYSESHEDMRGVVDVID
ncbi:halocyanin domain-containing protein [Halorubrum sp. BOL3-1]|uniref:plastocyanin/azurin family copper-binding protein n=1 Tax=Halorubrum sp. BOL3-1 TaxID=2497325 RepID=UPI001004FBC3|nr:plastocyanin/azurin family copper-binding protein [Halorubrum sp. BOL3-1]QAU11448.1 halocyanin domain-containing protein [Halorubrum sp. BOL3-1]